MFSCLPTDEALEKEDRIDENKEIKHSPSIPHLLQAQQAPALPHAKVVGCPSTGSYPAPSPDSNTHVSWNDWKGWKTPTHPYTTCKCSLYSVVFLQQRQWHLSRNMTKPTKWVCAQRRLRKSLGICLVWLESSLSIWRKLGSLATHWAHSEDSDQTGRTCRFVGLVMRRLIYIMILLYKKTIM